jgi:alanyl-tRNA synthetase
MQINKLYIKPHNIKVHMVTAQELLQKYIDFFKSKKHAHIPSASLVPQNDATVLFTTAGMHPLVPFLLGQKHPLGTRIVNVQKCLRTGDIDEVGDNTHHTFFQMLGNWSFGDYFKKESIEWSYEFLTSKQWLNLPLNKLTFTVYEGDATAPKDTIAAQIWEALGVPKERITYLGKDNFWSAGETGPCGPSSEIFYWTGDENPQTLNPAEDDRWVEIWNNVFMSYNKQGDGSLVELSQKNIDTGMGFERTLAVLNHKKSAYETDLFNPIIGEIESASGKSYAQFQKPMRVIADHLRASVFLIGDEHKVLPSNTDQGYVLRKLIRRSVRMLGLLGIERSVTSQIVEKIIETYAPSYPELQTKKDEIILQIQSEEQKFLQTLAKGLDQIKKTVDTKLLLAAVDTLNSNKALIIEKNTNLSKDNFIRPIFEDIMLFFNSNSQITIPQLKNIMMKNSPNIPLYTSLARHLRIIDLTIEPKWLFDMFQSQGMPAELTLEEIEQLGFQISNKSTILKQFSDLFKEHQEKSRAGAEQKFKGGLSDSSEMTVRLHTATHLLNEALRKVISKDIVQKGSNITPERLRFDFNFDRKLTDSEIKAVEDEVNSQIAAALPVTKFETTPDEAKAQGAQSEFGMKYPPKVSVYLLGTYSKEICMGPHVENTKDVGHFKILKEESSAAGVRRIKAVVA